MASKITNCIKCKDFRYMQDVPQSPRDKSKLPKGKVVKECKQCGYAGLYDK